MGDVGFSLLMFFLMIGDGIRLVNVWNFWVVCGGE